MGEVGAKEHPLVDNMIERVARALSEAGAAVNWEHALQAARSAILVMREPTIDQAEAARVMSRTSSPSHLPTCKEIWAAGAVWRAMIDSALTNPQKDSP